MSLTPLTLLSTLPAMLALTGFVVYQVLRSRTSGGQVMHRILEKVRSDPVPEGVNPHYKDLGKKDLLAAIKSDQRLRAMVDRKDSDLLTGAMSQQFITDLVVYLILALFAVVGLVLFARNSEGPLPPAGTGKAPAPAPAGPPLLDSAKFEKAIHQHYVDDLGALAKVYVGRRDTKRMLLEGFVQKADRPTLELGSRMADVLRIGFCPEDATAEIDGLDGCPGPEKQDLRDWVKTLEDIKLRSTLQMDDGKQLTKQESLEWYILLCGTLAHLETDKARKCREDGRTYKPSLGIEAVRNFLLDPRSDAPRMLALVPGLREPIENFQEFMAELPEEVTAQQRIYAGKYVSLLKDIYHAWRPHPDSYDPRRTERKILEWIRDLLEDRGITVIDIKIAS